MTICQPIQCGGSLFWNTVEPYGRSNHDKPVFIMQSYTGPLLWWKAEEYRIILTCGPNSYGYIIASSSLFSDILANWGIINTVYQEKIEKTGLTQFSDTFLLQLFKKLGKKLSKINTPIYSEKEINQQPPPQPISSIASSSCNQPFTTAQPTAILPILVNNNNHHHQSSTTPSSSLSLSTHHSSMSSSISPSSITTTGGLLEFPIVRDNVVIQLGKQRKVMMLFKVLYRRDCMNIIEKEYLKKYTNNEWVEWMDEQTGMRPIHVAVERMNVPLVKFLIEKKVDVNIKDLQGWSALHFSSFSGNLEICQILLEQGNAAVLSISKDGTLPLHYLIKHIFKDQTQTSKLHSILSLLLSKGTPVDAKTIRGETSLHRACYNGCAATVEFLIQNKATINIQNQRGETPLYFAVVGRQREIVKLLIENGADVQLGGETGSALRAASKTMQNEIFCFLASFSDEKSVKDLQLQQSQKQVDSKGNDVGVNGHIQHKNGCTSNGGEDDCECGNLSSSSHPFYPHVFVFIDFPAGSTYCSFCKYLLWGIRKQGFQCEICEYIVHPKCRKKATLTKSCGLPGNKNSGNGENGHNHGHVNGNDIEDEDEPNTASAIVNDFLTRSKDESMQNNQIINNGGVSDDQSQSQAPPQQQQQQFQHNKPITQTRQPLHKQNINRKRLESLYNHFITLDKEKKGIILKKDFNHCLGPILNCSESLANSIFYAFSPNKEKMTYIEFLTGVSILQNSNFENQIQFAFIMLDRDRKGYITVGEFLSILESIYLSLNNLTIITCNPHFFLKRLFPQFCINSNSNSNSNNNNNNNNNSNNNSSNQSYSSSNSSSTTDLNQIITTSTAATITLVKSEEDEEQLQTTPSKQSKPKDDELDSDSDHSDADDEQQYANHQPQFSESPNTTTASSYSASSYSAFTTPSTSPTVVFTIRNKNTPLPDNNINNNNNNNYVQASKSKSVRSSVFFAPSDSPEKSNHESIGSHRSSIRNSGNISMSNIPTIDNNNNETNITTTITTTSTNSYKSQSLPDLPSHLSTTPSSIKQPPTSFSPLINIMEFVENSKHNNNGEGDIKFNLQSKIYFKDFKQTLSDNLYFVKSLGLVNHYENGITSGGVGNMNGVESHSSKWITSQGKDVSIGHVNWELIQYIMIGIRRSVGEAIALPNRQVLKQKDFELVVEFKYEGWSFKDHYPLAFKKIRERLEIDTKMYMFSLGPERVFGNLLLGNLSVLSEMKSSGRSGSVFFKSTEGDYLIKTIPSNEESVLKSVLPSYVEHIKKYPNSLLVKVLGCHTLSVKSKPEIKFIVMNNLFFTPLPLSEKYDLKGSVINRKVDKSDLLLPDIALKDQEFKRKLDIGPEFKAPLLEQIEHDTKFLESHNICDYSLLVGIHTIDSNSPLALTDDDNNSNNTNTNSSHSIDTWKILEEEFFKKTSGKTSLFTKNYGGIISRDKKEVYFISIIDTFTTWDIFKKSERFIKFFSNQNVDLISAVAPLQYRMRFQQYVSTIVQ